MKYKKGDLLEAFDKGEVNIIAHQCNCTSGFGAGIARAIRDRYKGIDDSDRLIRKTNCFGSIVTYPVLYNKFIYNMYSQYYTGSPSNKSINNDMYAIDDLDTRNSKLKHCLEQVKKDWNKDSKLGFPLIASGLAASKELKGSMTDLEYFKMYIAPIIEDVFDDTWNITVYYL